MFLVLYTLIAENFFVKFYFENKRDRKKALEKYIKK